jgi:hypothetical protein
MVQSVESSNRIEGVVVEPARLRPLVLGKASPRNRSDGECDGTTPQHTRIEPFFWTRKVVASISANRIWQTPPVWHAC